MSTMFGRVGGALAKAQELASQHDLEEQQRQQQALQSRLAQVATLAGLQNQGIDTNAGGGTDAVALGKTGYYQHPSLTPQALAKATQAKTITQRIASLRRDPLFANASDDELMGIASDEPTYSKILIERFKPSEKVVAFDQNGRPVVYDKNNPQLPPNFVGKHEPALGSDEWKTGEQFKSSLTYSPDAIKGAAARAGAIARAEQPFRRDPNQPRAQRLPTSVVDKLAGLDAMEAQATRVRDSLKNAALNKTDATGRALGGLMREPGWLMNLRGKGGVEGENIRTDIGNLYATVAKERGGTALSAAELNLLESYIPNKDEEETTALRKANKFITALQDIKKSKIAAYQKYGYGIDDEAPMMDQQQQQQQGGGDDEAAWVAKNPAKKGESFEAYHQRFLKSRGG